jgi:hypothetical protein
MRGSVVPGLESVLNNRRRRCRLFRVIFPSKKTSLLLYKMIFGLAVPTARQLYISVVTSQPPSVRHNNDKEITTALALVSLLIATVAVLAACGGGQEAE